MDTLGIQIAILSMPAGSYTPTQAREFDETAALYRKRYPDRFGFFATLPDLNDTQAALDEITYSLDVLKADGVALTSSYGEGGDAKYIGNDAYDPVWDELNRRKAVVFLHGAQLPSSTPYPHPFLGLPITEVPNETFKAASHLVVTGKKRKYPDVKIILAHLGGSTPFLASRVAVLSQYMGCPLSSQEILHDFKSFYYETALSGYETNLAAMENFVEPDRILFGTDFPAVSKDMAKWYSQNIDDFYRDRHSTRLTKIMRDNGLELLPRLRSIFDSTSVDSLEAPSS